MHIETDTVPCTTVDELATELCSWHRRASAAAQQAGVDIAAVGTSPVTVDLNVTHKTPRHGPSSPPSSRT